MYSNYINRDFYCIHTVELLWIDSFKISETFLGYFFWNILVKFFSTTVPLRNKLVKLFFKVLFRSNLVNFFLVRVLFQKNQRNFFSKGFVPEQTSVTFFVQFHSRMDSRNARFYSFRDNIFALFRIPSWCNIFENKIKYSCWVKFLTMRYV